MMKTIYAVPAALAIALAPFPFGAVAQATPADIDGTYLEHVLTWSCPSAHDDATITHQGNTLTLVDSYHNTHTGPLNDDGSFTVSDPQHRVTPSKEPRWSADR